MSEIDIKLLALKILIVENQLEAKEAPSSALSEKWIGLLHELCAALNPPGSSRTALRIPTRAKATLKFHGPGVTKTIACHDVSWTGLRVTGDVSELTEGQTVELETVMDRHGTFTVNCRGVVKWLSRDRGQAGIAFEHTSLGRIADFYQLAYDRYINALAGDERFEG